VIQPLAVLTGDTLIMGDVAAGLGGVFFDSVHTKLLTPLD
jgi:hypothetical protein